LNQNEIHASMILSTSPKTKTIVVETHSDYLIDQIRIDLRNSNKKINPDDVAIYYFARDGARVSIRKIKLDEFGNVVEAPVGYRKFFIQHENTLLGLDNVSDR